MKYLVASSSGKDSSATCAWADENLSDWEMVFCDTEWEDFEVYEYNRYLESFFNKPITVLKSKQYNGFIDLCIKKKRVASTKARFCTEELKTKPMIDYILSIEDDVTVLQGVRNDESESRRNLKMNDEYFKFYFEPYGYTKQGKPKYHTYRKKDVIAHLDKYSVDVYRPIIKWSAQQVFDYLFSHKMKPNPLYFKGFSRVGCFPCVSCRQSEIKIIAQHYPERIDKIRDLENAIGTTFFPAEYIPKEFCDRSATNKKGEKVYFASIDAIVKYVIGNPNQLDLFPQPEGCISHYNICEKA